MLHQENKLHRLLQLVDSIGEQNYVVNVKQLSISFLSRERLNMKKQKIKQKKVVDKS